MKKTNYLFGLVLSVLFAITFVSCDPDVDLPAENDPPVLELLSDGVSVDTTMEVNSDFTVKLKAVVGTGALKTVTIYKDSEKLELESIKSGLNANPAVLFGDDQQGFEKEITLTLPGDETSSEYSFFVEDVNGLKDSVYVTVTTVKPATLLNFSVTGIKVYNYSGPFKGSIDLQEGIAVSSSVAAGDVQDVGLVDGDWAKKIKPKNGTEMRIPAAGVDFDSMETLQELLAAYDNGVVSSEADVVEGSSYLFKTKEVNGQSDFFILKNTEVHEVAGNNEDYYVFDLKGFKF